MQNNRSVTMKAKWMVNLCVLSIGLGLSITAQAASFNCNKAGNATERAICSNSRLSEADVKLANTYNILMRLSKDYSRYDLKDEQMQWLRDRNQCGSRVACISEEYQYRQQQLENALARFGY